MEPQDDSATLTDEEIETRPIRTDRGGGAGLETPGTGDDTGDPTDTTDTGDDTGDPTDTTDTGDDTGDPTDTSDTGDDSGDSSAG